MKGKQFFCEHCGHRVALDADRCPSCGRLFEAVKCPECAFFGKPELFSDGCPSCGYLSGSAQIPVSSLNRSAVASAADIPFGENPDAAVAAAKERRGLPRWAYTAILAGLIGFLVFLAAVYINI